MTTQNKTTKKKAVKREAGKDYSVTISVTMPGEALLKALTNPLLPQIFQRLTMVAEDKKKRRSR
jgi:hypothetical protein